MSWRPFCLRDIMQIFAVKDFYLSRKAIIPRPPPDAPATTRVLLTPIDISVQVPQVTHDFDHREQGRYSQTIIFLNRAFPGLFIHFFFINFFTQFNIILFSSHLLSCCHIHAIDDFLNYGTLLSSELEQLPPPESTEGGSPLSVCTSI